MPPPNLLERETNGNDCSNYYLTDKINSLQIQMDRMDCKTREMREDQLRENLDLKP